VRGAISESISLERRTRNRQLEDRFPPPRGNLTFHRSGGAGFDIVSERSALFRKSRETALAESHGDDLRPSTKLLTCKSAHRDAEAHGRDDALRWLYNRA
jgi:hypothetical protein